MSSECHEIPVSNNASIDTIVFSSGSSLIDMLNQQSCQTTSEDKSLPVTLIEDTKLPKNSELSQNNNFFEYDKLSTLFNTTGRERNSTGPLKQWLYEHQEHPYPKESDKQELMKQTNMSASQITIWFTNARVKMRKENKLSLNSNGKKKKKKPEDTLDELISFIDGIFPSTVYPSKQFVIAYSSLSSEQNIDLHRLALFHPNQITISDCVDEHTTHLIIGKEEQSLLCPLTTKLFQSIARHLFIITPRWINDCLKDNNIIDEINYEIRGEIPFGEYHDGMRKSRLSQNVKLFENCQFFILCDHCQNYMSKTELTSLIQLCHGSLLNTFPLTTTTTIDNPILTIVLCNKLPQFDNSKQQQLFELSRSNGVFFLNPEWILESIVQFTLQPFDFYEEKF